MAKILVIDDEPIIRRRLKNLLELDNHNVLTAENGKNGLNIFKKELKSRKKIEIVLVDIKMPGMDGIEVLKQLKEMARETEVILITGHGGVETAIKAMREGAYSYIQKPIEYEQLEIDISRALEKQELEKKLNLYVKNLEKAYDGAKREIDARKKAEEELSKAKEEAEQANSAKNIFLAVMSHELRTPLNAVIGFCRLLDKTTLDEKQQDYLKTIKESGEVLLELINDILDISKIEAGELILENTTFDLQSLIKSILKITQLKLKGKQVKLLNSIQQNMPRFFSGDPTRIRQILFNLLNNAIKFTEKGQIEFHVKYHKPEIIFSIKDTGIGIPKEKQEAIFNAFTQADTSTTRQYGGSGLGLSISKALVEKMGGIIQLKTGQDKGSLFTVTLPLKESEPSDGEKIEKLEQIKGKNVLIIDKDIESLERITAYCNEARLNILLKALSCSEVRLWLSRQKNRGKVPPDAVITSSLSPDDTESCVFIKEIKEISWFEGSKYIAIAERVIPQMAERFKAAGFNAFLFKPVFKKDLFDVLIHLLAEEYRSGEFITMDLYKELSSKKIKVLVAEDNPVNAKLILELLKEYPFDTELAKNGKQAVEKIKDSHYDLCLMDIKMPVMGGIEASKIIHNTLNKDLPIIALTAAVMKGEIEKCLSSGINDYIEKPVDPYKLQKAIRKWIK
jgi:two-component system sensor histidine kinase/response regulator